MLVVAINHTGKKGEIKQLLVGREGRSRVAQGRE